MQATAVMKEILLHFTGIVKAHRLASTLQTRQQRLTTQPHNCCPDRLRNKSVRTKQIILSIGLAEGAVQPKTAQFSWAHPNSIKHTAKYSSVNSNRKKQQIFGVACLYTRKPCLHFTSTKLHHIMREETLINEFFSSRLQCPIRLTHQTLTMNK